MLGILQTYFQQAGAADTLSARVGDLSATLSAGFRADRVHLNSAHSVPQEILRQVTVFSTSQDHDEMPQFLFEFARDADGVRHLLAQQLAVALAEPMEGLF